MRAMHDAIFAGDRDSGDLGARAMRLKFGAATTARRVRAVSVRRRRLTTVCGMLCHLTVMFTVCTRKVSPTSSLSSSCGPFRIQSPHGRMLNERLMSAAANAIRP